MSMLIDYTTGKITFGYRNGGASDVCDVTSAAMVNYTVWTPIVVSMAADSTLSLTIGTVGANFATATVQCPAVKPYPSTNVLRDLTTLGGSPINGPMMQVASFAYIPRNLTTLETQILLYAPPSSISPGNFIIDPPPPTHLFLGETFDFTYTPNSYSTLSGPVQIILNGGTSSFSPSLLPFLSDAPQGFRLTAQQFVGFVNATFSLVKVVDGGDDYYFNSPRPFTIPVSIGFWKVIGMPRSMLPRQAVTVCYSVQSNPIHAVTLNFIVNNGGATITPTSLTWINDTVAVGVPKCISIYSTATQPFFNLSYTLSNTDAYVWNAPPNQNITVSATSSFEFTGLPDYMYSGEISDDILVTTGAPPRGGINLTISSTLGAYGVVSTLGYPQSWHFPAGVETSYFFSLHAQTLFTNDSSYFILNWTTSGNATDIGIFGVPQYINMTVLPQQPLRFNPPLPLFVYENEEFSIGMDAMDSPVDVVYVRILPSNGTLTSSDYITYDLNQWTLGVPSMWDLLIDPLPEGVMSGDFGATFELEGTDRFHYFTPDPIQITVLKPTQLLMNSTIPPDLAALQSFVMYITFSDQPPASAIATLNIFVTDGSVFPTSLIIDSSNWNVAIPFTYISPSVGDYVECSFTMSGTDQYAYVVPEPFEIIVHNGWLITNVPDVLNIFQLSGAIRITPLGLQPALTMFIESSCGGGSFAPDVLGLVHFTPSDPYEEFYYTAPGYASPNCTLNFTMTGGPDRYLFFNPGSVSFPVIAIDFGMLDIVTSSWNPALPVYPSNTTFISPPSYHQNTSTFSLEFPYCWGFFSVLAFFNTPGSVLMSVENQAHAYLVAPFIAVSNQTQVNQPLPVDDHLILLLNSTVDAQFYQVDIYRKLPDMQTLEILPVDNTNLPPHQRRFLTYPVATGNSSKNWRADVVVYNYTLPWSTDTVSFDPTVTEFYFDLLLQVLYDDTAANVVTLTWNNDTELVLTNQTASPVFLDEGLTTITLNASLDGIYIFNFERLPPNIVEFDVLPIAMQPSVRSSLISMHGASQGVTLYPGNATMSDTFPYFVNAVNVSWTLVHPEYPVRILTQSQALTLVDPMTCDLLCSPTQLPLSVGLNTFYVYSLTDNFEPYKLLLTRQPPDFGPLGIFGVNPSIGFGGINDLYGAPTFFPSFSPYVFTYGPANVTNVFAQVFFKPTSNSGAVTNITFNGVTSSVSSGGTSPSFNLTVGLNCFDFLTVDGDTRLCVWRNAPSVTNIQVIAQHRNMSLQTLPLAPPFQSSKLDGYATQLALYAQHCIYVSVLFAAPSQTNLTTDTGYSVSLVSGNTTAFCYELASIPAVNYLYIHNDQDGVYTILTIRQSHDVQLVNLYPNAGSGPGPTAASPLTPLFDVTATQFTAQVNYVTKHFGVWVKLHYAGNGHTHCEWCKPRRNDIDSESVTRR